MKYLIALITVLFFHGCLYFNDRGVSSHLYDNCHSYYDANGNYHEVCDENIIDYDEAKEGVIAIKDEIHQNFKDAANRTLPMNQEKSKACGCEQNTQYSQPKEFIESDPCACK